MLFNAFLKTSKSFQISKPLQSVSEMSEKLPGACVVMRQLQSLCDPDCCLTLSSTVVCNSEVCKALNIWSLSCSSGGNGWPANQLWRQKIKTKAWVVWVSFFQCVVRSSFFSEAHIFLSAPDFLRQAVLCLLYSEITDGVVYCDRVDPTDCRHMARTPHQLRVTGWISHTR